MTRRTCKPVAPLHLSSTSAYDQDCHGVSTTKTKPATTNRPFAWVRLPAETQHQILHHALFPPTSTVLILGHPSHSTHMRTTAIPLFLALGHWSAYATAARTLYTSVQLCLFFYPTAAMAFLTSPHSLYPRSLVARLTLRMNIAHDLMLFDRGWRAAERCGGRVNIPTALHSMRVHGRLREVKVVLHLPEVMYHPYPDAVVGRERTVPSYYLPMARLQLAHWDVDYSHGSDVSAAEDMGPAVTHAGCVVVAPAFLASRAFQSGVLLLLKRGGLESVRLD